MSVHIWMPEVSILEKVLRSAVVYAFFLAAFRLSRKRTLGSMTPFDLIVLLVISNVIQNALIGNDNSLGGGLLGAAVLLGLNAVVAWATARCKRVERAIENAPTVIVKHGRILWEALRRERLSLAEPRAALRREGVVSVRGLRYVILEEDGHLSGIRKPAEAS